MSKSVADRARDSGGSWVEASVDLAVDAVNNALSGGTKAPNARQQEALIAAGYELQPTTGRYPVQNWEGPDGTIYGPGTSRRIALELLRNVGAPTPGPKPPQPGGPTVPDQSGVPSIPLPNIPGLPGSIPLPAIPGLSIPAVLGPIIAGGLLWPIAAGRGSDLRDLYGMPAPAPKGRKRGRRRTRTRARPRAIPGRGNPFPATVPKGRGGPVTISRPAAARPLPVVLPAKLPRPQSLPPGGVKIEVGPIKAPAPARVPQTRAQQAAGVARGVLTSPMVRDILQSVLSAGISGLLSNSKAPSLGRITLPGTGVNPLPMPSPLTASNPLALTYASPFAATNAATQEQDCSCRPARKKRKKKACKNPVTSRRSFKRGSRKFVTTTKELKCQA